MFAMCSSSKAVLHLHNGFGTHGSQRHLLRSVTLYPKLSRPTCLVRHAAPVTAFRGNANDLKTQRDTKSRPVASTIYSQNAEINEQLQTQYRRIKENFDRVENKTAVVGYGALAVAVLYVSSAVLESVDRLPLIPGIFKLVGVVYASWFAWRYLLFQDGRRDLSEQIQRIQDALSSENDDIQAYGHDLAEAAKDVVQAVEHNIDEDVRNWGTSKSSDSSGSRGGASNGGGQSSGGSNRGIGGFASAAKSSEAKTAAPSYAPKLNPPNPPSKATANKWQSALPPKSTNEAGAHGTGNRDPRDDI